jgi:hypothetical protein
MASDILCVLQTRIDNLEHNILGDDATPIQHIDEQVASNIKWKFRLSLVTELGEWASANLLWTNPWERDVHIRPKIHAVKAHQYVYEYLMIGKMLFPFDKRDPLFTVQPFHSQCLQEQLIPGKYQEFCDRYGAACEEMEHFRGDQIAVTWQEVTSNIPAKALDFLAHLQDHLCKSNGLPVMQLGDTSNSYVHQNMIGLVLRYMCIGGFTDCVHANIAVTIQPKWPQVFDGFVECFASPFNHVLPAYHSMFEEDKLFGSRGNFFEMLSSNGGKLPPGNYQMDPPPIIEFLETVAASVQVSLTNRPTIIMMISEWKRTRHESVLNSILRTVDYQAYSIKNRLTMKYIQTITQFHFKAPMLVYGFSTNDQLRQLMMGCNLTAVNSSQFTCR